MSAFTYLIFMPEQLSQRVEHCYQLAEAFFSRSFVRPQISFKLRGQKAGVAHLTENKLRFNWQLYQENHADFLLQTVAHEVAHMIAHQLYGPHIQAHGQQWKQIMLSVYQLPAQRCHHYDVTRRKVSRFIYRCSCADGEFPLSAQRHAYVAKGRRYLCRRCKATLVFSGEQRVQ